MARCRFGDVVKEIKNNIDRENNPYDYYIAGGHMDSEELHIHRRGSFKTDDVGPAFIREFKKGQVLYGSRRTYLKKVAVADFDGVTANTTFVLETKDEDVLLQSILPFVMLSDSFTEWSIGKSKGSTNPYVLFSDLADYEFELPPLEKQRTLAKLLWEIDSTKCSYKDLIDKTDEVVKSQFIEMFGRPGQDDKGWGLTTLGQCCMLNPRNSSECNDDMQVSFVPMPAVSDDGQIDTLDHKAYGEIRKGYTHFAENDVLFAKITPCMENGKGAVAKGLMNGIGAGSTEFHVLRPIPGKSNPYWLYELTMLDGFRDEAKSRMTGTGGQLRVPIGFLDNYPISLPPIETQNSFETIVEQSDKSKFELNEAIKDLDAMYKWIIKDNLG
ncbi:restriction endonuclease subunit S [Ligilactobacillus ruminis]|uniref:restriction endonuclease subunit S n=1 Tax=Ligilactobacillus ruminis TaxID=1623 RepID=UPI0022E5EFC1|nr:restriction endonuclease subunit S [Ligilactobacillus ruminis]